MSRFRAYVLAFAVLSACVGHAADLQPRTYTSQSGEYVLTVNPSERSGAGKGSYALTRSAKPQWSIELPFTLWDAVVGNDGAFAGYAYSDGFSRDSGDFIVAVLDSHGAIRVQEKAPRTTLYLDIAASPKAAGMIFDNDHNRFVVRVDDADAHGQVESWWTYDLADAHPIGKFKPKELMADAAHVNSVVAARPIANTPLTLVQWLTMDACCESGANDVGTRFTLIDTTDRPVWTLDLPTDYTKLSEDPQDHLLPQLREQGAILSADHAGSFDLWHVAENTRVSYTVTAEGTERTGWRVKVVQSQPYVRPPQASASRTPVPPAAELKQLGSITLSSTGATDSTLVRDIFDFTVADGGRFAFLTGCACADTRDTALVVIDRSGRQLHKIALPVPQEDGASYEAIWIGGDRWVVTRSTHGVHTRSKAFALDAAAETVTPLEGFDAAEIKSLASTADGGFVALTTDWSKSSATDALSAFDSTGKRLWTVGNDYSDEAQLFSPESVTVTSSQEVVVLENIRNDLEGLRRDR